MKKYFEDISNFRRDRPSLVYRIDEDLKIVLYDAIIIDEE